MLIRGYEITKYKYKLKYLRISAGIKKINDINNIKYDKLYLMYVFCF